MSLQANVPTRRINAMQIEREIHTVQEGVPHLHDAGHELMMMHRIPNAIRTGRWNEHGRDEHLHGMRNARVH